MLNTYPSPGAPPSLGLKAFDSRYDTTVGMHIPEPPSLFCQKKKEADLCDQAWWECDVVSGLQTEEGKAEAKWEV